MDRGHAHAAPAGGPGGGCRYVLRLYVTGLTPHSTRAVANLKALCEEHLAGAYDLEVIDLYQQPALARDWLMGSNWSRYSLPVGMLPSQ